jgi:plasmid stabilization system protein ParE
MEEISDYIAYDSPKAANEWIDTILDKVDLLKTSPGTGRIVPELGNPDFRELIVGNYRIIYRSLNKAVRILTVRNFKQILPLEDLDK